MEQKKLFYLKMIIAQMNREMEWVWETTTMKTVREPVWGTTTTETAREPEWEWAQDMVKDKRNQKEYASDRMMNPDHILSFHRYFNY